MIALVEGREPPEDAQRDRPQHPAGRADHHLPARRRAPCSRSPSTPTPTQTSSCSSPCWCASSRRRSAACSRPSASPAWTAWCSATCWRCRAGRSRRPATRRRCCSTRPARSPSATGMAAEFLPVDGVTRERAGRGRAALVPGRRDPRGPLDRRPGQGALRPARARDSPAPSSSRSPPRPACAASTRTAGPRSARAPPTRCGAGSRQQGGTVAARARRDRRRDRDGGRHAARRGRAAAGGRPRALGVIYLKDTVKPGIAERFDELRRMGIRTVMITGDNPLTAAAIADGGGRRRLPRRGHARGQDGADQGRAGAAVTWSP